MPTACPPPRPVRPAVRAASERADLVFVTVHRGVELDTRPRPDDVARARALIDAGSRSAVASSVVEPDGAVRGCLLPYGSRHRGTRS